MIRYVVAGCAALAVAACGWAVFENRRADAATARAKAAEAQVIGYREAAAMLDAHLTTVKAARDRWAAAAKQLNRLEGADDALNPYERAVLDLVRTAP